MDLHGKSYDAIIVGSGAGGATLAKELAGRGMKVLVVEKGEHYSAFGDLNTLFHFHQAQISTKSYRYSREGIMLLRTYVAGGSTIVSCGNGMRCLEKELAEFGITLEDEFTEAEEEMKINPYPEEYLSNGSRAIIKASRSLGYTMELMPKFIDPGLCSNCGLCFAGCNNSAKWTAADYLSEAEASGARILYNTSVSELVIRKGKVEGIHVGRTKNRRFIGAGKVILSAGGLATPVILNQAGVEMAGRGLFVDSFVNIYGITDGLNQRNECPMALVDREFYEEEGFILSTFVNPIKISRFAELGIKAMDYPLRNLIGFMVKIRDERAGVVHPDGTVSKPVTKTDQARFDKGESVAREILSGVGADEKSMMVSKTQGAHPGGTAAIGEIVNDQLETEIGNLYVCDGSVLPAAPGLPPILTIVALAKRLAKSLS